DYVYDVNGHPQAVVPGINTIASWGTTFYNSHASSPKCAPSRTSMLTGKDLFYTQVYINPTCKPFRDYFTAAKNNEEVFTLPEYLKDNGYFTYGINKTYHCFDTYFDFDSTTADPCSKELSWSKYSLFTGADDLAVLDYGNDHNEGVKNIGYARIPDSMEYLTYDYRAIDSVLNFVEDFHNGVINTCGDPFFITIGLRKPHTPLYVPEKYFSDDYLTDFYEEPFDYPYNLPEAALPYNGVLMPPQPDTIYQDFYELGALGSFVANYDSTYEGILDEASSIGTMPVIELGLTDDERVIIIDESLRANTTIAYLAATQFVDAQILRFIDSLQDYPEIFNNSIFIFASDHGFSLGEKRHWLKGTMWENDLRAPFIIADMRNPLKQNVYASVSLLDIFPTVCDLTGIPYPEFANGDNYIDGKSLMPFLSDPNTVMEAPVLASYKVGTNDQCSCFPQFSIRNNRFHYILYTSNNAGDMLDCDRDSSWYESELYEIGEQFETDPNEWNNLIDDSTYKPLVNYLQQWLPDSALYLQKTFSIAIQNETIDCLLKNSDTLRLSLLVYDTSGTNVLTPEGYLYKWTNNLTGDIFYGDSIIFPVSYIDYSDFISVKKIAFNIEMIDSATEVVCGFDIAYY
ncbi:MAG: sulfatase-like hydrolase/transferase, partial [Chitinophagales bacterium]